MISVSVDGSISQWLVHNGRFVETCWISGLMAVHLDQRVVSLLFERALKPVIVHADVLLHAVAQYSKLFLSAAAETDAWQVI